MAVLWLLLVGLSSALAKDIPAFFIEGDKLTLEVRPPSSEPITNILWKFKGDLLAEWIEGQVDLMYYSNFNGRTTLDTRTGRLVISNTTKADIGPYSVDINNKVLGVNYNAEAIKAVPKPKVELRTLTCAPTSESCNMTCEADTTGRGPVTYSWKMGDGEWKESNRTIAITKADTSHVKTITCRVQNPLTAEESEPEVNPLFEEEVSGGGVGGDIAGGIIGALLVIAAAVGGGVMYKNEIGPFKGCGSTNPDAAAENGKSLTGGEATPTPSDTSVKPSASEQLPLTDKPKSDDEENP